MEVKKVVKEWEIWNEEEEAAKLESEAKKLVLEYFYKWIYIFGKKASEKNADQKDMRLYYWYKERICTKKREGVSIVKKEERRSAQVYLQTIEKRVYQTLKVASNSTSILCRKEEWEEVNGVGL